MLDEKADFVDALESFLKTQLEASTEPAEYNTEAIRIVDARNHLFTNVGRHRTDEEAGIYALRSLCHIDEDTLETVPDRMRIMAIAKDFFS